MRGLLLAGTDTGVGKTAVGEALLRLSRRRDLRLVPFKPVETGCSPAGDFTPPALSDAQRLCSAAGISDLSPESVCPQALASPTAPSVAARLAGTVVDVPRILAQGRALLARGQALLVESAGGLLTPYAPGLTSLDLSTLFDISILLVSANRLGTINHTALAVAAIRAGGQRLAGIVLVDVDARSAPDRPYNASEIAALTGVSPLGTLRHCPNPAPDVLADALAADVRLDGLLDGAFRSAPSPQPP